MVAPYRALCENHFTAMNINIRGRVVDIVSFPFFMMLTSYYKYCFVTFVAMVWTLSNFQFQKVRFVTYSYFFAAKPLQGATMLRKKFCNNF